MGRDSNPRCPCGHAGFQDRCLKPLGHPSFVISRARCAPGRTVQADGGEPACDPLPSGHECPPGAVTAFVRDRCPRLSRQAPRPFPDPRGRPLTSAVIPGGAGAGKALVHDVARAGCGCAADAPEARVERAPAPRARRRRYARRPPAGPLREPVGETRGARSTQRTDSSTASWRAHFPGRAIWTPRTAVGGLYRQRACDRDGAG